MSALAHSSDRLLILIARVIRWLPLSVRRPMRGIALAGRRRHCPVCRHSVRRFLPMGAPLRSEAMCPWCESLERHRFTWAYLERKTHLLKRSARMLHLSPERGLVRALARTPVGTVTSDIKPGRGDLAADLAALPFPQAAFDLIYCSHVLEHVDDDRAAMAELHRVVDRDGVVLVQVPVAGAHTVEDPSITSAAARLQAFGQEDHVRLYGMDVTNRLEEAGFSVTVLRARELFDRREVLRFGIEPEDMLFQCTPAARVAPS